MPKGYKKVKIEDGEERKWFERLCESDPDMTEESYLQEKQEEHDRVRELKIDIRNNPSKYDHLISCPSCKGGRADYCSDGVWMCLMCGYGFEN